MNDAEYCMQQARQIERMLAFDKWAWGLCAVFTGTAVILAVTGLYMLSLALLFVAAGFVGWAAGGAIDKDKAHRLAAYWRQQAGERQ